MRKMFRALVTDVQSQCDPLAGAARPSRHFALPSSLGPHCYSGVGFCRPSALFSSSQGTAGACTIRKDPLVSAAALGFTATPS